MSLLADHNLPFAVALAIMVLLAGVQLLGLDFATDADGDISFEGDADIEADSGSSGILASAASLLGIGRVPTVIWLAVFLFAFAIVGVSGQSLADSMLGAPVDTVLASILAAGAALPVTGMLVRPLGAILPQDETSAVGLDTLVGRRGKVTTGTARAASPARTAVTDYHGHTHYVMLEPHDANSSITEGEQVLLVRREGELFFGQKLEERHLAPS